MLIEDLLLQETAQDSISALKVYEEGAFSWPYAELTIKEGLPIEVRKGVVVKGISASANEIVGSVLEYATAGSKVLKVQYQLSDVYSSDHQCEAGANPHPNHKGCFGNQGAITIEGYGSKIHFTYDPMTDNKTYRSLQKFSTLAPDRMKPCHNCRYFKDYQQFLDYYDEPTYADKWIGAAFAADSVSFRRGSVDFSGLDAKARAGKLLVSLGI